MNLIKTCPAQFIFLWLISCTVTLDAHKLSRYRDIATGHVAAAVSQASVYVPSLFARMPESMMFSLSEIKAKNIFWNTYAKVPAYKDFIAAHCGNKLPKTFKAIPVMSKANYIKKYDIMQTLLYGVFPPQGQIDTSTGTSGKPTKWIRGHKEMENARTWIRIASNTALGSCKSYIFCNMFALGPWATGITSTYALTGKQLVISIGPDLDKLYDVLQEFGTQQPYVIAGYPPHMKKFVENAPFDLSAYDITIVVGGEAISENVYNSITAKGIIVYSSYGASDLRINIGQQIRFEHELQNICAQNAAFKQELLGTLDGSPLFFHYNPLLDYIEETAQGNLLFTDLDPVRVSPRVRYDLGDKGKILKNSRVRKLLKKYGYTLAPTTNLPFICLYGRGEDALTFNGANLMYDDLERALVNIPELSGKINRYAYNKFENKNLDQVLEFWIEFKEGASCESLGIDLDTLNQRIMQELCVINQDFKSQIAYINQNKDTSLPQPRTYVYALGTSPMVTQQAHHKNKYVYSVVRG